ncbi:neurogenic locus notch homolog protein 2-like [Xenia sp. Carnegie-2017]|uniref:neurogenic locus notch homolog protein 2-like n=1 Tax=Xenia sp. Carnegie-2017 TaxID=2897299 RepID=UPI001F03E2FD|nr:neurogenic locus notch homolog protein 2-like [Xenia sp. Carnegie-2017]
MSVSWNFWSYVKVTVSGKYKGMMCNTSLCGNNNGRQDDDHYYSRKCAPSPIPCIPDSKKKAVIDKCHLMSDPSSPFHGACNRYVDPAALISNCKYDACRCTDPMECVCNAFAAYSKLCVEYGGLIDWRFNGTYLYPKLKECEQTCSNKGEIFTECGSACAKTCRDISRGIKCSETCIPGCHCPKGSYLDDKNHCVPMKNCSCFFEGKYYKAGENVKVGRCKTCTCNMGAMACVEDRNCSSKGPCESFPCKNDGVCTEKGNIFTCICTKEYQGKTCEVPVPKPCDLRPCKNNGICTNNGSTFSCECADGFKGETCEVGVCDHGPCKNGGSCLVDGNSYKCICLPDFIGAHCEKEVPNPCKPNPCKNGGQCNVLGNIYTCKCKPAFGGNNCEHSQTTCSASGDPHYTSFDGKRFDFMGDCEYEFSKDCSKNKLFTVLTKNVRCGRRVTCTAAVKIIIAGYFIQLTRQRGTAVVNGVRLSKFPIIRPGFKITNPSWSWLIFTTDIGMSVSWNFWSYVKVTVSGKYKGMMCNTSLCGNNNGRQDDDHYYSRKCAPSPTPCIPDSKKKVVINKCHLMSDPSSPFHGACNRYVDPANLISNCKYDACRCTDPMECVCNAFAAYSKLCVEYGGFIDWRFKGTYLYPKLKECEQTCSNKGEIFTECGSACAKTCRDISRGIKCSETCIPGCHCPKGSYLDDKNHCVPMKNCSCFFEGKYYKAGENVKVGRCKTCTCNMGAMACVDDRNCSSKGPCESFPCKNDGVCIEEGNKFTCICTKEYQGKTCEELKPTPCDSGPCKNNGTCTNKGDNFTCECADGFEGKTCEVMNACAKEPCKNDGVCASNGSSYQCECKFGFIGKNCQYMDACAKEPCQNNGTCTSVGSSYQCNCTSGFNGKNCEVMIISSYKECRQYQLLNESTRNVEYRHGGSLQCDFHLTKGWYRFSGGAGTKMPESCVPKNRCGTHASGWLNGTHPTVDEGIVTRKVCYHWVRMCCDWSNHIKVINCGPYFIYKLVPTFGCYFRYCGTD